MCNLACIGFGRICKLKTMRVKESLLFSTAGFRGIPNIYLASLLTPFGKDLSLVIFLFLNTISLLSNKLLIDHKDEANYLISANPCSRLKTIIETLEETYIMPVFLKENLDNSIVSPKFNENSQRFEAGIQLRQEPRDETSRELQALNLNITESEIQGALQLK